AKSARLAGLDGTGNGPPRLLPAPVPRPLTEVRGRLADLLARAGTDLAGLATAWVKVVLTDRERPVAPMERLRERWPHTIALDFAPEGGLTRGEADRGRLGRAAGPVENGGSLVEAVAGPPRDDAQVAVLRDVVATAQRADDEPVRA